MRYAARRDSTEGAIVDALERAGCKVWVVGGAIDLCVWTPKLWVGVEGMGFRDRGAIVLIDCKTNKNKRGRRVRWTKTQRKMLDEGWPIVDAVTPEEALRACGFTVVT